MQQEPHSILEILTFLNLGHSSEVSVLTPYVALKLLSSRSSSASGHLCPSKTFGFMLTTLWKNKWHRERELSALCVLLCYFSCQG